MTDRELMQMALDDICGAKLCEVNSMSSRQEMLRLMDKAIEALRAALAQPEQEPVAYWRHTSSINQGWDEFSATKAFDDDIPLYTAPPQQPEQEPVATLFGSLPVYDVPPKQEPVAWVETLENARPHCVTDLNYLSVAQHERGEHLKYIPLYTTPPQREWQGLTDDEIVEIAATPAAIPGAYVHCFARAIEAKLKQKNYQSALHNMNKAAEKNGEEL